VTTVLTGTSPLVMHNPRLADPDDSFAREIAQITSKRKKTDEDRWAIDRLKFLGGLYMGRTIPGVVVPAANLRRCFVEAAKIRKLGRDVTRAVIPLAEEFPLIYDGPEDPEALWKEERFRYRTTIVVARRRLPTTRPYFPAWELSADFELVTETLDRDDFEAIVQAAGIVEGLGDNRINGMGRFTALVKHE
jgi:hypothetical protein